MQPEKKEINREEIKKLQTEKQKALNDKKIIQK